ncbi:MAG: septum formation initiator family protein [Patescibacteria group bacterium]|mgnify:FL=1
MAEYGEDPERARRDREQASEDSAKIPHPYGRGAPCYDYIIMSRGEFAIFIKQRWLVVPLTVVFLFSVYLGLQEFWRWYGINKEYTSLENELANTQNESEVLRGELADLSRPEALEKQARAKLNLKKQGESMLVVVSEDNFPQENFLAADSHGLWAKFKKRVRIGFDNPDSIWFNVKGWYSYIFPQ